MIFTLNTGVYGQMITLSPANAGPEGSVVITFNAAEGNGELIGATKVYMHHGVITDSPSGTAWKYVKGNWGADDGVGLMTKVQGESDMWQITLGPSIRQYFGVPSGENIYRIAAVFRNTNGSKKGTLNAGTYPWGSVTTNQDNFINLSVGNYVTFSAPLNPEVFVNAGSGVNLSGSASGSVSSMKLWIDEGAGYIEKASITTGTTINFSYVPTASGSISVKITAIIGGENVQVIRSFAIYIIQATPIAPLPLKMRPGINYHPSDPTIATLVLQAPGKNFAYVVGDFNSWGISDLYQMNQTPDGEYFWLEIGGLVSQQEYVFQYWIDGSIKIGDPYADKVADPWNDSFIDAITYPGLPVYSKTNYGIATVLQTNQSPYTWASSETTWQRPDVNHLVIYELLVRDFVGTHSFKTLTDTLAYFKRLGVNAIEIMPFNEFEGNESWGYNPSYYFAPDKYYGSKNDIKKFVETAHQQGLAVIMDMVLNHANGQNALLQMYFDNNSGKPAANNPWFNQDHVGPYAWGYDFNHESTYTKAFADSVNSYWIKEFHIDGYRFDFTKGFTNYSSGGSIEAYDQSRINILERMADQVWLQDPNAYIILEHWGSASEEQVLGNYGMKLWKNRSYDYVPAVNGSGSGNFSSMNIQSQVSYFDSHDERRIAEHALNEGLSSNNYDVRNPVIMYERVKMAAAFSLLNPGPKMIWQFDELGYDIHIDYNGRIGNKPLPWGTNGLGYYEDSLRQHIYKAYQGILDVRKQIGPALLASATANHIHNGNLKRLSYDMASTDLVVIGNFGLINGTIVPGFTQTGLWYDYFSGQSINVSDLSAPISMKPGEWHIYTTTQLSAGVPSVVKTYFNPVTITPSTFTVDDEITIVFDAAKASPKGTAGLIGATKVYMHSGVISTDPQSNILEKEVGTLTDDGIGQMASLGNNLWSLTLVPKIYFGLTNEQEIYKIGMYFRDESNTNLGMGFRDQLIFNNVESAIPFITIEPASFTIDDPITITFNARKGNRELAGVDKIYMHSSVDITNTDTPQNSAWNKPVGNWGKDDGVGKMVRVSPKSDLWKITLTPRSYYNLNSGQAAYWMATVFRNADGTVKGTGIPGQLENGFIHTNQDFFVRNQIITAIEDSLEKTKVGIYPNPANDQVTLSLHGLDGIVYVEIIDISGRKLHQMTIELQKSSYSENRLDLKDYPVGMYFIKISGAGVDTVKRVLKR